MPMFTEGKDPRDTPATPMGGATGKPVAPFEQLPFDPAPLVIGAVSGIVGAALVGLGIAYAVRERRRIVALADEKAVDGLAKLVRLRRSIASRLGAYADRIRDRADST